MRFSAATAGRYLPERLALRAGPLLQRLDALLFASDERSQAGRMSLIAFAIRILGAVVAIVSQVLLARWMGVFEYGIFVLVWTALILIGDFSCLGFHTSVVRFIPEYRERGQSAELRGILLTSRLFALAVSTAVAGLGLLGVWAFSGTIAGYYVLPFYLGLLCLPMMALSDVLQGIARANSWVLSALTPAYITRPILILALTFIAMAIGYEADAQIVLFAALLATCATAVGLMAFVTAHTGEKASPGPRKILLRQWILISLPIFLVESFFFLLTNADVLMVGRFMEPDDVGVYFATVKTLALVHFVYFAVKAGVAQRYAQFAQGDKARLETFARETVSWTFWPSLAMALIVLAVGKPMLTLFGPGFEQGYPLLFPLVAGVVARAAVGPAESLLTMSGNQNVCAAVYGVTLALNIALAVVLIPLLGLWGAALATSLAMTFEAVALAFTVWRRLGILMTVFGSTNRDSQV